MHLAGQGKLMSANYSNDHNRFVSLEYPSPEISVPRNFRPKFSSPEIFPKFSGNFPKLLAMKLAEAVLDAGARIMRENHNLGFQSMVFRLNLELMTR
jgi:hypothetical protein